jgi:hypothetical protein
MCRIAWLGITAVSIYTLESSCCPRSRLLCPSIASLACAAHLCPSTACVTSDGIPVSMSHLRCKRRVIRVNVSHCLAGHHGRINIYPRVQLLSEVQTTVSQYSIPCLCSTSVSLYCLRYKRRDSRVNVPRALQAPGNPCPCIALLGWASRPCQYIP